jgi:outer membrane protein
MTIIKSLGILIVLVNLVLSQGFAFGGEATQSLPLSKPLTMEDALTYGLEHNRSLKATEEDVNSVDQKVRQSRADLFPKLDAEYNFRHLNDAPFAALGDSSGFAAGPVKFQTGYENTNHWELNVSQPLFTGFGLTSKLKISKMDLEISKLQRENTRLDVIRKIKNGFLQTLLSERLLQVAKDNVESLEVQRANAVAYFEQGLTPQNDVLKAEVALAQAKLRERTAVKQLTILRAQLNQLLDLDLTTVFVLADVQVRSHMTPPPLEELYSLAEKQDPNYLALETSVRQAKEGVRLARSRYYPQLSAFGQYYREGGDFSGETNKFTNNENAAIGVRVDLNLFEGGKTMAAVKELEYRRRSLEQQRLNLKEQIKVQVEDAYEKILLAKTNIHAAQTALNQAEENKRMTTLQYRNQLVIFLEVLNAEVFVLQSRVDYYQALYGFELAWADLERAVGGPVETARE